MFNIKLKRKVESLESSIRSLKADIRFTSDRYHSVNHTLMRLMDYLNIEEKSRAGTIIQEIEKE